MYGTTTGGGINHSGTVYRITTNGDFNSLYSFSGSGSDGDTPYARLVLAPDGFLYGTTDSGGSYGLGTVFKTDTNGALSTIYSFSGTDGSYPDAGLCLGKDGAFYGTTSLGGASDDGTVFRITTTGSLTTLVQFNGTNGASPLATVAQTPDGSIYGTTSAGGTGDNGVIFQIATNGSFAYLSLDGIHGSYPDSGVVLGPDGNLYTLAENGGVGGYGNIFRVDIVAAAPVFQKIHKVGSSILLSWSAVSNRAYQLQFKTNLAQENWNNIGTQLTATTNTLQTSDTPGTDPRRYYRVFLVP
jgi:uncharacterized repeat protein (TIGR03803 family)